MEAPVEVVLPAAVAVERLMGSSEGFGSGGSGGVAVGEVRWHIQGACSSGGKKDDIHAINVSSPAFLRKIPDSKLNVEVSQPASFHSNVVKDDRGLGNMKSISSTLDQDVKPVLQNPGKMLRKNSGCTKRSVMVQMEVSKSKLGLHDVNGISPEIASSSASCTISEKNQLVKQKISSTSRRGDKRNSKVKHKSKCDFSLKNGLVGLNSAAGGNSFLGIYGLKPDVFDITKYVDELSLDELLRGSSGSPCIAKDKGKKVANPNNCLLQSVRSVCSIIQAQKVLQAQNCGEIDSSCIQKVSTGSVTLSSAIVQIDGDKGDSCTAELPSSDKVQEPDDKIKMSNIADLPLYKAKDVLERLALPPPKDLDLLLSDTSKTTSSKSSTDHRQGKQVSHRTGLPPFPWSHSFSGHNKLGSDAVKLSTTRTTCQGRWIKVEHSPALQKGSADLLADFESLSFDQSLVPLSSFICDHPANEFAPIERGLSASGACPTSKFPTDEYSTTHAAAQTLLDMAACSKENPCAAVKLLKRPSQMAMKASKLKAIERSDKLFDAPKTIKRLTNSLKAGNDDFLSKKPRLTPDVKKAYYIGHTEPVRKETLHRSSLLSVKSPPRKLFRDSNASTDIYGVNLVKKSCAMKTPRREDKPTSKQKFWKSSQ